ncbi:MAG: TetR/AcrR family transcriptional regulator [Actinomycetota bacterium]|nr:TetR/AcrR family transcriptional regulator [Actinomycetota bacterium]
MDPSDPRAVRTRQRVLDAAVKLLAERGVEATTMDAVACAASISRSTLYRHWPERLPLLIDAIEHLGGRIRGPTIHEPAPNETLEATLQRVIGALGAGLRSPEWGAISGSLAAAAEHDEALAEVHRRYVLSRQKSVIAPLQEAQRRGELPYSLDLEWAVDLLAGPLYYQRLVLHEPLSDDQVAVHVRGVVTLLLSMNAAPSRLLDEEAPSAAPGRTSGRGTSPAPTTTSRRRSVEGRQRVAPTTTHPGPTLDDAALGNERAGAFTDR